MGEDWSLSAPFPLLTINTNRIAEPLLSGNTQKKKHTRRKRTYVCKKRGSHVCIAIRYDENTEVSLGVTSNTLKVEEVGENGGTLRKGDPWSPETGLFNAGLDFLLPTKKSSRSLVWIDGNRLYPIPSK